MYKMSLNEGLEKVKLLWNQIDAQNVKISHDVFEESEYLLEKIHDDTKRLVKLLTKSTTGSVVSHQAGDNILPINSSQRDSFDDLYKNGWKRLDSSPEDNFIDSEVSDSYQNKLLMQDTDMNAFINDLTDEDFKNVDVPAYKNLSSSDNLSSLNNEDNKSDSDATDDEIQECQPQNSIYLNCLKKYFGYSQFKPLQWKIIDSVLNKRKDNCVIMSTGYGKSLCYQYPSVFTNRCSIIISPLISLMEDQVMSLSAVNIASCFLGSAQQNMAHTKQQILKGKINIIYMTPEFAVTANDLLTEINNKIGIDVLAIDEAHCVSQWGNDFRISYRSLGNLRSILKGVPIMALTATATPEVRKDICKSLQLVHPIITCSGFDRPNLFLCVNRKSRDASHDLRSHLMQVDGRNSMFDGSTIIYCPTKKSAEEVETVLRRLNCACALYHAGLSLPIRKKTHQMFINDQINVIVATVAFGMGIDKPDVRNIIHYGAPKDIESYYQEIGRAGRDGVPSKCIVYYSSADFNVNRYFLSTIKNEIFLRHKEEMLKKMEHYLASSTKCRREMILSHFNGKMGENKGASQNCCDNCENCLSAVGSDKKTINRKDLAEEARLLFESIQLLGGKFGLAMPIMLMRGSTNQKLNPKYRTSKLFGGGKSRSEQWWKAFARQLISEDYLAETSISGSFGSTVDVTTKAKSWLRGGAKEFLLELNRDLLEFEWENMKPCAPNILPTQLSLAAKGSFTPANEVGTATPALDPRKEKLEAELYSQLIRIRNEISQEIGLYSFNIFSNKILLDMSKYRPTSMESVCAIEDVAMEKASKYGDKFIAFIKQFSERNQLNENVHNQLNSQSVKMTYTNTDLSETIQTTYQLFQLDKLTLDEVAKSRNLKCSTLVSHLCTCLSQGLSVDVHRLDLSDDAKQYIAHVISQPPINNDISRLVPIKQQLPDHSFDQIKIVIALLQSNRLNSSTTDSEIQINSTKLSTASTRSLMEPENPSSIDAGPADETEFSKSEKKRKLPNWMNSKSSTTSDKNLANKKIKNSGLFK